MDEKIYFEDEHIRVTATDFEAFGRSLRMDTLVSVQVDTERQDRGCPTFLLVVSLPVLLVTLLAKTWIWGLACFAVAALGVMLLLERTSIHRLRVRTASQTFAAITSQDRDVIERIREAIAHAMEDRPPQIPGS